METLYTVGAVAQMTGLTERTIRNYIKDGKLRGKKVGVQWRFTKEDVEALFEDVAVGKRITESNYEKLYDFLEQTPLPKTGIVVINEPVEDESKLEAKVRDNMEFTKQSTDFKFSFQYLKEQRIAQFILFGDLKVIEKFMEIHSRGGAGDAE